MIPNLRYVTGGSFSRAIASDNMGEYKFFSFEFNPLDAPHLIPCGSTRKDEQFGTFTERDWEK